MNYKMNKWVGCERCGMLKINYFNEIISVITVELEMFTVHQKCL